MQLHKNAHHRELELFDFLVWLRRNSKDHHQRLQRVAFKPVLIWGDVFKLSSIVDQDSMLFTQGPGQIVGTYNRRTIEIVCTEVPHFVRGLRSIDCIGVDYFSRPLTDRTGIMREVVLPLVPEGAMFIPIRTRRERDFEPINIGPTLHIDGD